MDGDKLSRREFLRVSALGTVGAVMVACVPAAAPPAEQAQESGQAAEAAPAGEKVQIEWWPGWPGQFMIDIGDLYMEQNPNVELNVVSVYPEMQQVLAAVSSGTAPDIIADVPYMELIIRGVCQPLDDFIEASDVVAIDDGDIREDHWEVFSWEGSHYGVPAVDTAGRGGMSFNLNVIEEAGLDTENLPTTWEEVFAWHQQITKYDDAGNIDVLGMNPIAERAGAATDGDPWLWPEMWGFHYISDTLEYQIDRPETVEFFGVIQRFFDEVGVEKMEGLSAAMEGISRGAFGVGKQAMQITYPSGPAGVLRNNPDHTYKFTWVPVPESRRGTKVQTLSGHASILMRGKQNPETAFDLAVFLTTSGPCDLLFKEVGWLGPRRSWQESVDLSEYPPEVQENILFFSRSLDEADELWFAKDPIEGITATQWVNAREDVIYHNATPDEVAQRLQQTLTDELADAME